MIRRAAFFSGPYDEAMALLVEARDYIAHRMERDQDPLPVNARLQCSFESMRLTTRLTQAMAWLLAQKAVHAGEMSMETLASEAFALGGAEICSDTAAEDDAGLPDRLRSLLSRSHGLYVRVGRLDEMVRRAVGGTGSEAGDAEAVTGNAHPTVRVWGIKPVA